MDSNILIKQAQKGLELIENAIVELLRNNPELSNTDIAKKLNLRSSHEGKQRDYLTYSILGGLMVKGVVYKDKSGGKPNYRLK